MNKNRPLLGWVLLFFHNLCAFSYDITIFGYAKRGSSIAEHTLSFLRCLDAKTKIQFLHCRQGNLLDLSSDLKNRLKTPANKKYAIDAPIAVVTDFGKPGFWRAFKNIRSQSIKFAYIVTERTDFKPEIKERLNKHFDGLLVPDQFVADVCRNQGISIPVFVLPLAIDLENYFQHTVRGNKQNLFIFGCSATFFPRKNQVKLVTAFAQEFKNNPKVKLVLHGRDGWAYNEVKTCINNLKISNVELRKVLLNRDEYEELIKSFDCFVLVSKGEGFSIVPRECLAAGIPCILTNNTAHRSICSSSCVYSVPSDIVEPSICNYGENVGFDFNCKTEDVCKALRTVYDDYAYYQGLAEQGRKWVRQYCAENLKSKYMSLIKPKKVTLGTENSILDSQVITDSKKLYAKYKMLLGTT